MRNHGWQLPYHPLQVIAVCVLYVICTACDPVDPGVKRSRDLAKVKKAEASSSLSYSEVLANSKQGGHHPPQEALNEPDTSIRAILDSRERNSQQTAWNSCCCKPLDDGGQAPLQKSCCSRKLGPDDLLPEPLLYCSICQAEISMHSKHCRACDKCVHGFDHHCRWLNNCVGKRNYKSFVALMVACLLMLVLQWATGIVVLVRCFTDRHSFQEEIMSKLGSSFSRAAFIVIVVLLTFLAMLATAPITQLFCFHVILMHKGITTYDYILAVREQEEHAWEDSGLDSLTTSPATSTDTGFSGYSSTAGAQALHHGVFCTPPRVFVEQDQNILALSDMEIGGGRGVSKGGVKAQQKHIPIGVNPWKLARMSTEDAAKAAARARENSSIIHSAGHKRGPTAVTDTENVSCQSLDGEIGVTGSQQSQRKPYFAGKDDCSTMTDLQDRSIPLTDIDSLAQGVEHQEQTLVIGSSKEAIIPLPLEACSTYRGSPSTFSCNLKTSLPYPGTGTCGDLRASYPESSYPGSSYPGSSCSGSQMASPDVFLGSSDVRVSNPVFVPCGSWNRGDLASQTSTTSDMLRLSANSDGYEASGGESGDDYSDVGLRLIQSWSKLSFNHGLFNPVGKPPAWMGCREENVKPWANLNTDSKSSTRGGALSTGSRVEANILKQWPELQNARFVANCHSSFPTRMESPLCDSSEIQSVADSSCSETPDRGRMNSFFYDGPFPSSLTFKAGPGDKPLHSTRRLKNSLLGLKLGVPSRKNDIGLLDTTP
ncbi:hypothetical protein BDL97_05G042400 [Sphagnum fallax]|nr:hypothetical protein BDL97_05G042400 [Sphagnum fallax]